MAGRVSGADAMDAYHDVHLREHPGRARVWEAIAGHLAARIPATAHVLEVGAGHCAWINAVRAERRVALDVWRDMPRHAAPGVEPVVADAAAALTTFGAGAFDVVLASNLLEHFPPDDGARLAADLFALLRPGGRLLVMQPNFRYAYRSYFDDYTHRAIYTDVSLPAMLRACGFGIEEVRPRFLPYSMRRVQRPVPRWLVSAYLRSPFKPGAGQMLVVAVRPTR